MGLWGSVNYRGYICLESDQLILRVCMSVSVSTMGAIVSSISTYGMIAGDMGIYHVLMYGTVRPVAT